LDLPFLAHSEARLAATELPPFEQAIAAGVDSVMTAHLLISAWDQELPATLSPKIVTEILRQRLNFSGLVITDALIMGGITQYEPADLAVMAVEAGTDILLMPDDPEVAIAAVYDAVQTGRIDQSRIHQSLKRIWHGKQQINQAPHSNIDLNSKLSSDRARVTVNSIVQKSLQHSETTIAIDQRSEQAPSFAGAFAPQSCDAKRLSLQSKALEHSFRDDDLNEVPRGVISDSQSGRNLIIVDDVLNATYLDLNAPAITIPQSHNYQRQLVDRNSLNCILADPRPTLLQLFIRGNPFRGNAGLTEKTKAIYQKLLTESKVMGIAIYGSPYVLDWFKAILEPEMPWVFSYGQMPQSQEIALQTLFADSSQTLQARTRNFGF
ncbi:MAG: glycoside hydrolase family 3 N-terminal domain-containing protein, partial [Cyanobacteria bacterium J06635_13]